MAIRLLPCPLCLHPHFDGARALRVALVGAATAPVACPVCPETLLGLDKLTIHLFGHVGQEFREEIDRSIEDADSERKVISDSGEREAVKCDICSFSFDDRSLLEMHQKLLHQTLPDKRTGSYSYHCHLCSKQFRMRGSLMVHLRVAHCGYGRGDDGGSGERGGKEERSRPSKVVDNKQWECDVCSKMFTTKYFLKKHKRLHTGEMPYCCTLCNKSFTFQQSYHKHMLYHSSEKPHVCNECGRAFKELSTLQNHARIHSGERPFVCETCGKSFRQRVSYLVHRRIHTGVMPYKCTACNKSFRYKVSQKSHKCPMNPPGSVVLIPEPKSGPDSPRNSSNCAMNVDLGTGNISVESEAVPVDSLFRKKSIAINDNECIEIRYKQADLQLAIQGGNVIPTNDEVVPENGEKGGMQENLGDTQRLIFTPPENDSFSVALSNILPEVESLYLHGSPTNDNLNGPECGETINMTDIRATCLEEFLCDI